MTTVPHPAQRAGSILLLLLLILLSLLAACGDDATPSPTVGPAVTTTATAPPITSTVVLPTVTAAQPPPTPGATATATMGPDMFANPVVRRDFPDPDVLKVGDTYYAYATNAGSINIQAARSTDLVTWELLRDALPVLPAWASPGNTWAPEVTTFDASTYLMYFTARRKGTSRQCIGVATADKPEGPFRSSAAEPWICDIGEGGDIDASSFVDDDGTPYVLWKNDGNCCGIATWLYIQPVTPDGQTLTGERTRLIREEGLWEGNVIEAPTLWQHEGKYYLFYSANAYNSLNYAVGYAVADTILGPYTKSEDNPILFTDLQNTPTALGPGGQDILLDPDGETWIVYHSWNPGVTMRWMNIDRLRFENGLPVVEGPTLGPQHKP